MHKILLHIRTCIVQGFLAVFPLGLCLAAVLLLYYVIDRHIMVFVDQFVNVHQIPGFGIFLLVVVLYVIGLIASNIIGRQFFQFIEGLSLRIPLVKHIYSLTKQLSEALSKDENAFQKPVLVNYPNIDQWTVGFMTGRIKNQNTGEDLVKVYIPMCHPVIGFVYLAREQQVIDPGWSMPETVKMLVSVGIISPQKP